MDTAETTGAAIRQRVVDQIANRVREVAAATVSGSDASEQKKQTMLAAYAVAIVTILEQGPFSHDAVSGPHLKGAVWAEIARAQAMAEA